jgi:TRAP-type transport system periplasmic protein
VGSPIFIDTFKALGANPVSMNWGEALSSFQQGTVDGQENPVVSVIIPNKLWQVHKYMTAWGYAIDPLILGMSKEVWDGLPMKDKEAIKKVAAETVTWQKKGAREGLEGTMPALELLRKNGMEVTVLSPDQSKAFINKTRPVYEKWEKEIGPDLVKLAEKEVQQAGRRK